MEKVREIFLYEEIQIHLDRVQGLGIFIEFERKISNNLKIDEIKLGLLQLMRMLEIPKTSLESRSYSDMFEK